METDIRISALRALLRAWMLATKRRDLGLYRDFVSGIRQGLAIPEEFGPEQLRDAGRREFEAVVKSLAPKRR